jgi:hypothetical protein
MPTDVQLDAEDGSVVVIDARVVKAKSSDFNLDSPARRGANDRGAAGMRRALVHDQHDGLTINFNRDYPGGVTINDVVELNNRRTGIHLSDVVEISPFAGVHAGAGGKSDDGSKGQGLVLRGQIMIERNPSGATSSNAEVAALRSRYGESGADHETVSVQRLFAEVQAEIVRLEARVAELERRERG